MSITFLHFTLPFPLRTSSPPCFGKIGTVWLTGVLPLNQYLPQLSLKRLVFCKIFYDNPHIYLPFRLPTLHEKAEDSELSDLIYATISEANPPLRTLHNIIGNFFKPSAVLAALGGSDSTRKFVYGGQAPNEWAPKPPTAVELQFTLLRERVLSDTIQNPELRSFMAERWFPKKSPPLDKDDFWHSSLHTPPSLVVTAASPSAPSALIPPLYKSHLPIHLPFYTP